VAIGVHDVNVFAKCRRVIVDLQGCQQGGPLVGAQIRAPVEHIEHAGATRL
jgi:hypothetical protein